jgi:D-alanyl-D-alanine carboxypeptidase
MQNPIFQTIVSTQYYAPRGWKNKNKMLTLYEGGIGVKTGYTKQAGRCLVSAAKRNGMTLVCTLLNCPTTYERTSELLDDAYAAYSYEKILDKDEQLCIKTFNKTLMGCSKKDIYYPLLADEKSLISIQTKPKLVLKKQEFIGEFSIYLAKQLLFSGNLYKL